MGALTSKPYAFLSRPWELKNVESIDMFDTYHSSVRFDYRGNEILRVLPVLDERINEEWISDKIRFFYDALQKQRLSTPWISTTMLLDSYSTNKYNTTINTLNTLTHTKSLFPVSWSLAIETFERIFFCKLLKYKKINISKIVGNTIDLGSLLIFKKLFLNVAGVNYARSSFFNSTLNDFRSNFLVNKDFIFKRAKRLILVYFNPRFELPLFNIKLRALVNSGKLQVFKFSHNFSTNFEYLNIGSTLHNLTKFLSGRTTASKLLNPKFGFESAFLIGSLNFINSLTFNQVWALFTYLRKLQFSLLKTVQIFAANSQPTSISASEIGLTSPLDELNKCSSNSNDLVSSHFFLNYQNDTTILKSNSYSIYFGSNGDYGALNSDLSLPLTAITESNSTYLSIFGLVRRAKLVLFSNFSEVRSFASTANLLTQAADRSYSIFERFTGTNLSVYLRNDEVYDLDYSQISKISADDVPFNFALVGVTPVIFHSAPTSFLNDFFLTDSVTRSSQFLSLASKNSFDSTTNFN